MASFEHEFIVSARCCRNAAIRELRQLGLRFQVRDNRIYGDADVFEFMQSSFNEFRPALFTPFHTQLSMKGE